MKTLLMSSSAIPVTPQERRARRPIGRDVAAYQHALRTYEQTAYWADELGFDAFGSTEHHFQTEGGESVPNSLLLYAKLAALTERIMFVPLSIVLTTHDPIRVAEDLAQFSHMFPDRLGVGFARGYQTRWLQTLTQSEDIAALNPVSDQRNRARFDEYLEIVEKAWALDSFHHDGPSYQVPYPATGIPHWQLADWTRTYGGPDEVDEEGTVRNIGVVPKPLTRPVVFIPSAGSPRTITDSARNGRIVLTQGGSREKIRELAEAYRDSAREAGRDLQLGESFGVVAKVSLGETYEEAFDAAVATSSYWHQNFFQKFYFNESFRTDADDPTRPVQLADERALTQRMIESGQLLCGTPEQVREQMQHMAGVYGGGALDWFVWEYWTQSLPGDGAAQAQRYQLETYAQEVMPSFR